MRERGLKLLALAVCGTRSMSLPMRERGLKLKLVNARLEIAKSLPMRERGLKRLGQYQSNAPPAVAPHAGAWIETGQE